MKYEVTTDLIVHTRIKVVVEADSKEAAIDAAADIVPQNYDEGRAKLWRATVAVKPPKGVEVTSCKAYHFEGASGRDTARKVA